MRKRDVREALLAALMLLTFVPFAFGYVTYPVPVKKGGTAATSFTGNKVVVGNSTGTALTSASLLGYSSATGLQVGSSGPFLAKRSGNTLYIIRSDETQGFPAVVSANPTTNGLMIVRGTIGSTGLILSGEGYTTNSTGPNPGPTTVTFSTAFQTAPSCTVSPQSSSVTCGVSSAPSTTSVGFSCSTGNSFHFICIGERPS